MAGNTPKERYDAGFKIGTSSDATRPISSADLVLIQDSSEAVETEAVRVGTIADLFTDYAGTTGVTKSITLNTVSEGTINLNFVNGILTSYTSDNGTGTVDDPYLVGTAVQLDNVRNDLAACYRQTADIALTDYQAGTGWDPIGKNSEGAFTGYYDGDGYKVTGLVTAQTEPTNYVGLFGYIGGATIIDLTVENASVSGILDAGILCGYADTGCTITRVCVSGDVDASGVYANSGGLVGYARGTIVSKCSSLSGTITAKQSAGGLIGYCINAGSGSISNSYALSAAVGDVNSGGLIGNYYAPTEAMRISNCYSAGLVSVDGTNEGGFMGNGTAWDWVSCLWDKTVNSTLDDPDPAGIDGFTTSQMQDTVDYAGYYTEWNFTTIWNPPTPGNYPTLR